MTAPCRSCACVNHGMDCRLPVPLLHRFFFFFFLAATAPPGVPPPLPGEGRPGAISGDRLAAFCGDRKAARPDRWLAAAFWSSLAEAAVLLSEGGSYPPSALLCTRLALILAARAASSTAHNMVLWLIGCSGATRHCSAGGRALALLAALSMEGCARTNNAVARRDNR